jgi:2-phospho-L-lactate guanylyltransferase (CobY/MobA/RfbA family)
MRDYNMDNRKFLTAGQLIDILATIDKAAPVVIIDADSEMLLLVERVAVFDKPEQKKRLAVLNGKWFLDLDEYEQVVAIEGDLPLSSNYDGSYPLAWSSTDEGE